MAITAENVEPQAIAHSTTWQLLASDICQLCPPMFRMDEPGMSDEKIRAAAGRDAKPNAEYQTCLPALTGRRWSSLSEHEQLLAPTTAIWSALRRTARATLKFNSRRIASNGPSAIAGR
ncbi:hypothetical protein LZO37_004325 [Salmonella enterica]|nr:hypothetical protein [Salmonella enterica]ECJ1396140.1 hypothetical protein [Salmonella enterica]ECR4999213.1 hypothetical protein [Salmonella enterica]ECY1592165.1 hypothetical protein [Salmonella enterica]EGH8741804.1 hypothetical protein [Salmonella enterica]